MRLFLSFIPILLIQQSYGQIGAFADLPKIAKDLRNGHACQEYTMNTTDTFYDLVQITSKIKGLQYYSFSSNCDRIHWPFFDISKCGKNFEDASTFNMLAFKQYFSSKLHTKILDSIYLGIAVGFNLKMNQQYPFVIEEFFFLNSKQADSAFSYLSEERKEQLRSEIPEPFTVWKIRNKVLFLNTWNEGFTYVVVQKLLNELIKTINDYQKKQ